MLGYKSENMVISCVLCLVAVLSNSLQLSATVARQPPLPMEILQAGIPERVAMPSSRGSSQPRDRTRASHTAGKLFTDWATREVC